MPLYHTLYHTFFTNPETILPGLFRQLQRLVRRLIQLVKILSAARKFADTAGTCDRNIFNVIRQLRLDIFHAHKQFIAIYRGIHKYRKGGNAVKGI